MLRPKVECEICGNTNKEVLHWHHIIPRADSRCTNTNSNIACICSNCHHGVHAGKIIIIGVYNTTGGLKPLWFKHGEDPPLEEKYWLVKDNPLVITLKRR